VSASFEFKPFVEKRFCLLLPPAYLLTADLLLLRLFFKYEPSGQRMRHEIEWFFAATFKDVGHPHIVVGTSFGPNPIPMSNAESSPRVTSVGAI
jgi:hypothetical protein